MKNPSQYHIQKRKDGRYVVTVMFKGKRQSIYGKTKKETLEKLTKVINDIQYAKIHNLQNFSASNTTLSDWATECVETYSKEYVRGSTYYAYKNIIKRHLGDLGNKRLADITNLMIQSHLLSLRNITTGEKLSPKMLINVRNFISLVFNYAIQNRMMNYNPVQGVKLPRRVNQPTRALTVEQQKRLETAVRDCERLLMFAVILDLYTGLRKGELLALQWKDIDFEKGCISVTKQLTRHHSKYDPVHPSVLDIAPPKTEASIRKVYMIDALKLELLTYKEKVVAWKEEHGFQHSEEDFLFTSRKNTAIEPRRFYQYYKELLDVAGIEDATFHSLRHTFATRCLEAGIDIVTVSKLLGHADSRITANTYSHLLPEYQKKEITKILPLFQI